MIIILQYISVLNYHVVYFKLVNYISIKLIKRWGEKKLRPLEIPGTLTSGNTTVRE